MEDENSLNNIKNNNNIQNYQENVNKASYISLLEKLNFQRDQAITNYSNLKIEYNNLFNVKLRENLDLSNDTDIIVKPLKQPSCSSVNIDSNKIVFDIEKELGIEIVGDTKVKIAIELSSSFLMIL